MTLRDYSRRLNVLLGTIRSAQGELRDMAASVPPGGEPDERLALLLDSWTATGADASHPDPAFIAGDGLAARVDPEGLRILMRQLVNTVHGSISRALADGARSNSVICSADFGAGLRFERTEITQVVQDASDPAQIETRLVAGPASVLGLVGHLPVGHALRSVLPTDGFFSNGGQPAIFLGPALSSVTGYLAARSWYSLPAALELTKRRRYRQLAVELEARLQREREEREREERRERLATTAGQLDAINERLERLERTSRG